MSRRTLLDFFREVYARGSGTAVVDSRGYRRRRWSYGEIAGTAARLARELEARGVGRGDRVLLWGENGGEWVAAFFGCLLRGAVVVPMDRIAAPDFTRRVAGQVEAKFLLGSRELAAQLPELPALPFESFPDALARHSADPYPAPEPARDDLAEIIFTSGTTADPKGVVLTHGNLLANLEPVETEIRRRRKYLLLERLVHPVRFLVLVPLSHVFGQLMGLFIPPLIGGTVAFQETLNPAEILRTCRRERVSVLVTVPRLLQSLKEKLERDQEAAGRLEAFRRELEAAPGLPLLRRWWRFRRIHRALGWKFWALISGGAALDPETEAFWRRLGYLVIQGYGMTETASLISVNHPLDLAPGSIGRVLPGYEFKLASDGEILVRGPGVAAGYWPGAGGPGTGGPGARLQPVAGEEGWFRTGDLGALDARGRLYFKGRSKDVIVTPEGMNVHPADLEAALRRQPEVRDCVVFGLERDANAEPCAVLLLRETAEAESVVRRANQRLAPHQQIRRWYVWPDDDFPRTPTQKPRTGVIQETVRARLAAPTTAAPAGGTLAELLQRLTGRPVGTVKPEAGLESDLNLTSIERVELLAALEDRYQVELDETRFTAATTVGELEQMLRQPAPSTATPAAPRAARRYPRWAQRWPVTWLRVVAYYLLVAPAMLLLAWPRVRGRERLRGLRAPALFVSNHITQLDGGFLLWALPARWRHRVAVAMGAERLWAMRDPPPGAGYWVRGYQRLRYLLLVALFNVFPLPRQSGFRESFHRAGELADAGWSVLVFPEGDLTPDGTLQLFQTGAGLLAANLGLPVVPLRIDGLFELKQLGRRWAPPGAVQVTIGEPVRFEPGADPATITRELERRVAALGSSR